MKNLNMLKKFSKIPFLFYRKYKLNRLKKKKSLYDSSKIIPAAVKIDILIPCIEKDLAILPYVIDSIRENIKHPIGKIFIAAPKNTEIKKLCLEKFCIFIDETSVLPVNKNEINYVYDGIDRSGWLFQQLLKLSADVISDEKFILVADADTVFIRPQVFITGNKILFDISDEYHEEYFKTYRKLTGLKAKSPLSFVSHHTLFNRNRLRELKILIENQHGLPWYKAVIDSAEGNNISFFSEYETYGNFMYSNYPQEISLQYWFNLSLNKDSINNLQNISKTFSRNYKTVSFHSYEGTEKF